MSQRPAPTNIAAALPGAITPEAGPRLDERAMDRVAGVLLGAAAGDALGVPYEFKPPLGDREHPQMKGGGLGPFAPGEYSDDTQMAVCIAEVAATGADLRTEEALDKIAANFLGWYLGGPADVGNQTSAILSAASRANGRPSQSMLAISRRHAAAHDRSAGNGSLMRTAVVALAYLDDPKAMAEAAALISDLTHADPDCAAACILWCSGIRTAVLEGTFDGVRAGLSLLAPEERALWAARLDEAENNPPSHFGPKSGWVVAALQAAWSAITRTPVPQDRPEDGVFAAQHFQFALEAAVRTGTDTDTVAAIAGALLGARWGCSAIPLGWQNKVHGWPTNTAADLVRLAVLTVHGGCDDADGWPSAARVRTPLASGRAFCVAHPLDPDVVLGNLSLTEHTGPAPVDAVVSLCRVGSGPILTSTDVEHVRVWLVDKPGANNNLHYVLDQATREVLRLRESGKRVLIHCVAGQSRTPAVAAIYSTLAYGAAPMPALRKIQRSLRFWTLSNNQEMLAAVFELAGERLPANAFRPPRRRAGWRAWFSRQ